MVSVAVEEEFNHYVVMVQVSSTFMQDIRKLFTWSVKPGSVRKQRLSSSSVMCSGTVQNGKIQLKVLEELQQLTNVSEPLLTFRPSVFCSLCPESSF